MDRPGGRATAADEEAVVGPALLGVSVTLWMLCVLVAGGGLAAAVVVVIVVRRSRRSPPRAFPVVPLPAGPGRFRVSGVRRDTRQDVTWECDADGPANAQAKAELDGIVV